MKTKKAPINFRTLLLASLFIGGYFFIYKSFAYASEDTLISLQKDVLAAKGKQAMFVEKTENVGQSSEDVKSVKGQDEAERLIGELTKNGSSSIGSKEISPDQKASAQSAGYKFDFPSPRSFQVKPNLEPKKTWIFSPLPKFLGFGGNNSYKLSDGEALYKVAVSDGKISIREAIDIGIANSIQLQALRKKVEVADAKWTEAKRALFPTAQLEYDKNGGHSPTDHRFYLGEAYKVNATQPLYYGGELVLTCKQAEENVKSAKADYEKAKNDFVHQVRQAYYGVVKTEYNSQYQADLLKEVNAVYKIVKTAHDQKLIAEVDYLNAESQYQQVNFSADSTRNDLLTAYLTLRQALNLDSEVDLPLDLKLGFKKSKPDFSNILNIALQNNPDVLSKELSFISAQDGIQIYEAKKRPRFDLRTSYGKLGEQYRDNIQFANPDLVTDVKTKPEWYVGVHGSMPFGANSVEYDQIKHAYGPTVSAFQGSEDWRHTVKFNLLDKLSDITDARGAQATLLQSEADWQKSRNDLIFKLKDDFYALQKALIQMDSAVAKMRYQEKQNGILKYTMSLQEATPANYLEGLIEQASDRFAFIQAVADYNLALSSIAVASGDPFYFSREDDK